MKISFYSSFTRRILAAGIVVLAVTLTGWMVVAWDLAGLCLGWPLCRPSAALGWLPLLHQLTVGLGVVLLLRVLKDAWQEHRQHIVILPLTTVCATTFLGELFVGALQATNRALHLRILHAMTAISLWTSLVMLILVSDSSAAQESGGAETRRARRPKDFLILTKPWIVALLLVTTITGLVAGYKGFPPFALTFWTLLGGALAAGGSSALNQYVDRDVDKHMQRTAHRPLASQRLTQAEGLAFGLALCIASYYILAGMVNLLAAVLSLVGIFYYVVLYSIWLKKATVQNIVIGGGAGAIPPLVGWAAATGQLPLAAWILFAIIFMWTPPHFWALAIVRRKDYERAGVPMLPVVRGEAETRRQILLYTIALVSVSLLLPALHLAGSIYLFSALILGEALLYAAWRVWRVPGNRVAFLMYRWSSLYLLFIFIALMVDAMHGHD